ncbi:flippase-like domain-containing protein [Christensenellaceae bacterium OttesenSCG-928-L17]|nr:flippase-like domain-containing protein [Christensenellaceae bacterium OttesenSCG-928-L17]
MKKWKKIVPILLPIVLMVVFILLDESSAGFMDALRQINPVWLLVALVSIVVYYLCDAKMQHLSSKYMGTPQKYSASLATTMIGFFYSALTPFSSGGQPMQVLQMRHRGIKVGTATSILTVKFLCWQLSVTLLGVTALIFLPRNYLFAQTGMVAMYIFGFVIFLSSVALAVLALVHPAFLLRIGRGALGLCSRLRLFKKPGQLARLQANWENVIRDFGQAAQFALKNVFGMLRIFFVCIVSMVSYMAVTYFICRGFGMTEASMFHVVLLQGLLYMAVSFIPLPGASIASEGGFYLVFGQLLRAGAIVPAVVLWRLITYYSALLIGGVFVVVDTARRAPKQKNALPAHKKVPVLLRCTRLRLGTLRAPHAKPRETRARSCMARIQIGNFPLHFVMHQSAIRKQSFSP